MNWAAWETTHPLEAIAIAQKAEAEARFLTDAELHQLRELAPQPYEEIALTIQAR